MKFNFTNSPNWNFHRSGWNYVINHLREVFHNEKGLLFYDWADGEFRRKEVINQNWGGILHNVINYPQEYFVRKDINIFCLKDLVEKDFFLKSLENCKILLTTSPTTSNFLKSKGIRSEYVYHPCPKTNDWEKFNGTIVTIGQWMRNIEAISKVKTNFNKIIVKVPWNEPYKNIKIKPDVKIINYISNNNFDKLIRKSVVFLNMYDAAACNTLLECIMGNVPIIINRLNGIEDYIGKDYPLFYNSIQEVSSLLNEKRIIEGHVYLMKMNKEFLTLDFLDYSLNKIIKKTFHKMI